MELTTPFRELSEYGGSREPIAVACRQLVEGLHRLRSTNIVEIPKWPAAEWREPDAEDRTDIPVPGRSNDSLR
jgi:hypothetical protein